VIFEEGAGPASEKLGAAKRVEWVVVLNLSSFSNMAEISSLTTVQSDGEVGKISQSVDGMKADSCSKKSGLIQMRRPCASKLTTRVLLGPNRED
jgi:hypothetical protein